MRATGRQRAAAVLLAVTLAATLASCGDDDPDLPELPEHRGGVDLPAPPTPTATLTAEETEAVDEVWAAYGGYMDTYVEMATTAGLPAPELEHTLVLYAEPNYTVDARNEALQNHLDGQVVAGELSWTMHEVVAVDLAPDDEVPPSVVLSICVDGSAWETVDLSTGEPVDEPAGRYLSTVTAQWREEREFGPDGWGLHERDDDRSGSC